MTGLRDYCQTTDPQTWDDVLQGSKVTYSLLYEKYDRLLYNHGFKVAQDCQLTEGYLHDVFLTIPETRERFGHTDFIKFHLTRSLRREIIRRMQAHQRFQEGSDQAIGFTVAFQYEPT